MSEYYRQDDGNVFGGWLRQTQPLRASVPMPRRVLDRIEEFRWSVRAPSRAEAMRALLEEGLANQERAAGRVERDGRK
jgi:hypothetical protein